MDNEGIDALLVAERLQVAEFAQLYSLPRVDYSAPIYPAWSALDVLGHIVFWHESFARNTEALASGGRPTPPTGSLKATNELSVFSNRGASKAGLLRRLAAAQATIELHIRKDLGPIPYRRGSRPYGPGEHLRVVTDHVRAHQWHVVRALILREPV